MQNIISSWINFIASFVLSEISLKRPVSVFQHAIVELKFFVVKAVKEGEMGRVSFFHQAQKRQINPGVIIVRRNAEEVCELFYHG